jgi:uncharacterized protein
MTHTSAIDPITRNSVTQFLARISGDYHIAGAWLYGSRARGDAGAESDADLAVILEGPRGQTSAVAAEMAGAEFDIMIETGVLVSAFPIWIEDWNNPAGHANPYLIANIKREGIAL